MTKCKAGNWKAVVNKKWEKGDKNNKIETKEKSISKIPYSNLLRSFMVLPTFTVHFYERWQKKTTVFFFSVTVVAERECEWVFVHLLGTESLLWHEVKKEK